MTVSYAVPTISLFPPFAMHSEKFGPSEFERCGYLLRQAKVPRLETTTPPFTSLVEVGLRRSCLIHPVEEAVGCQHQQEVVERHARPLVEVEVLGPAAVPAAEHSTDSMPRSSGIRRMPHTDLSQLLHRHRHLHHSTGHTELYSRLSSVQSLEVQALKQ
jgi:hypothetical protein